MIGSDKAAQLLQELRDIRADMKTLLGDAAHCVNRIDDALGDVNRLDELLGELRKAADRSGD